MVRVAEGSVSLNATPVRMVEVLGLLTVNVSVVVPLSGMRPTANALLMVGGATTVMLTLEVFPVPPSVEVTVRLLLFTPAVVPVTFTERGQEARAATFTPVRCTKPNPYT